MKKGPFDGKLVKYDFGCRGGSSSSYGWQAEATSLKKAILRFRVGCLFPFRYADKKWHICYEGVDSEEYHQFEDIIGVKPGATLNVHVHTGGKAHKVATIPVESDTITMDPRSLLPIAAIEALEATSSETAIEPSRLPQSLQGLRSADRREVTERTLALEAQMRMLELQKRELEQQVSAMKVEIEARLKKIWMIELYLGSEEEVTQLAKGAPALADEPITVRQRALCMDEEIAAWAWVHHPEFLDAGRKGFSYNNIVDFDNWITADPGHLAQMLPERKGIVAIRVRRHTRKSEGKSAADIMAEMEQDEADRMTYLLVRNGDNVYRLWIDTVIWPRFFPRKDEFDLGERNRKSSRSIPLESKDLKHEVESYLRGLVVLQGMLDRSTLFHPLPDGVKISVFDSKHAETYLQLIRDDEPALVADTSIMSWREYKKWLTAQVRAGARSLYIGNTSGREYDKLYGRTGFNSVSGWPNPEELHVVDEMHTPSGWDADLSFLYNPGDEVWESDDGWGGRKYDLHERKTRVRFQAYSSEMVPIDALSIRYLDYLVTDRSQREHYADSFLMLRRWKRVREAEEAREAPFVDLVLQRAGVDPRDPANAEEAHRCRRLVRWWKLKTKVGRTLEADEPKALRMVLAAFKRGQDYDGDPEKGLPAPQHVKKID